MDLRRPCPVELKPLHRHLGSRLESTEEDRAGAAVSGAAAAQPRAQAPGRLAQHVVGEAPRRSARHTALRKTRSMHCASRRGCEGEGAAVDVRCSTAWATFVAALLQPRLVTSPLSPKAPLAAFHSKYHSESGKLECRIDWVRV